MTRPASAAFLGTFAALAIVIAMGAATVAAPQDPSVAPNERASAMRDMQISTVGSRPSAKPPAEYFTGTVRLDPLADAKEPSRVSIASVTFEPGARTHWHTHPVGQHLYITSGLGWVQQDGGAIQEVRPGDVVWFPPNVKHWHGASPTTAMTHLAVQEAQDGNRVEWLDPVTDEQYAEIPAKTTPQTTAPAVRADEKQPSRAQQLMGDIAPKLATLTDDVLYGQVWEDETLSKRDRSLVTVSALIALNRPEQLRSHLALARTNGVTEEELVATITHLAFYAGWPNSVTAVGLAREAFEQE